MNLISHPKYPAHKHLSLSADINIIKDKCHICYNVSGDIEDIIISDERKAQFRDELWKMTCFEMFIEYDDGPHYYEYNFAPNGDWAAYHFDNYRDGMRPINIMQPEIVMERDIGMIKVDVTLDITDLPEGPLNIGLFAMTFSEDDRSFWALHHSEDTPNFHQKDCFLYRCTVR